MYMFRCVSDSYIPKVLESALAGRLSWRRNPFFDWQIAWTGSTFNNTGISLEGQKYVTLKATVFAAFVPKGQIGFFHYILTTHFPPLIAISCPQTCHSPLKSYFHPLLQ